jgi:hypothetical protein
VTGFDVEAMQQSLSAEGDHTVLGKRASANAATAVITGLKPDQGYDIEVRSMAGDKMSAPYTVQAPTPTDLGDTTPPVLTATPGDKTAVNVTSNITLASELNADIYYTIDGSPAVQGGLPSRTATHYTAPVGLSGPITLNAVAFDRAGNFDTFTADYKPPVDTIPAPAAVSAITGTAGPASVTLSWAAPEAGVTLYGIQAYVDGVKSGTLKETSNKTITITGLNTSTEYYFTVKAKNGSGYGPESTPYGPLQPTKLTDSVTIATAKWKSGDFRVTGSGSAVGAFLEIRNATATGPGTTVLGQGQVEPPVAPATTGSYDIRMRNANAPAINPGKIYVVSENGGVAGPFTVTAG